MEMYAEWEKNKNQQKKKGCELENQSIKYREEGGREGSGITKQMQ